MIRKEELLEEIQKCQLDPVSYANVSRLSDMFIVYDHLFPENENLKEKTTKKEEKRGGEDDGSIRGKISTVDYEGKSEFAEMIRGHDTNEVFSIMEELMETLEVIQPNLYNGVLRRIMGEKILE